MQKQLNLRFTSQTELCQNFGVILISVFRRFRYHSLECSRTLIMIKYFDIILIFMLPHSLSQSEINVQCHSMKWTDFIIPESISLKL